MSSIKRVYPLICFKSYKPLLVNFTLYTRTKGAGAFWNRVGVESVHRKPADINPGSLKWLKIKIHVSSELMVQIKQKGVYGVENPLSRSLLVGLESLDLETTLINTQTHTHIHSPTE